MARPDIANFTGSYVAFELRANEFFVLEWKQVPRRWHPFPDALSMQGREQPQIYPIAPIQGAKPGGQLHLKKPARRNQNNYYDILFEVSERYIHSPSVPDPNVILRIPILVKTGGDRFSPVFTRHRQILQPANPNPPGAFQLPAETFWGIRPPRQPLDNPPPAPAPVPELRGGPPMNRRPENVPPPAQKVVLEPIPRRIAWLVAEDAQKQNEHCGITFEDISPLTAAVTTCFHCFDANALALWFSSQRDDTNAPGQTTCPLCRKICLTTKAYNGGPMLTTDTDDVIEILDEV